MPPVFGHISLVMSCYWIQLYGQYFQLQHDLVLVVMSLPPGLTLWLIVYTFYLLHLKLSYLLHLQLFRLAKMQKRLWHIYMYLSI